MKLRSETLRARETDSARHDAMKIVSDGVNERGADSATRHHALPANARTHRETGHVLYRARGSSSGTVAGDERRDGYEGSSTRRLGRCRS